MTKNQIDYAKYKEDQRHHFVEEDINRGALEVQRGELGVHQGQLKLSENVLNETKRHNIQDEKIRFNTLNETIRHNLINEGISQEQNDINRAHYERSDFESIRHNKMTESIELGKLDTMRSQASAALQQAQAALMNAETNRANLTEVNRHNTMMENLGHTQNLVNTWSYQEDVRHNLASEEIGRAQAGAKIFDVLTGVVAGISAGGAAQFFTKGRNIQKAASLYLAE